MQELLFIVAIALLFYIGCVAIMLRRGWIPNPSHPSEEQPLSEDVEDSIAIPQRPKSEETISSRQDTNDNLVHLSATIIDELRRQTEAIKNLTERVEQIEQRNNSSGHHTTTLELHDDNIVVPPSVKEYPVEGSPSYLQSILPFTVTDPWHHIGVGRTVSEMVIMLDSPITSDKVPKVIPAQSGTLPEHLFKLEPFNIRSAIHSKAQRTESGELII